MAKADGKSTRKVRRRPQTDALAAADWSLGSPEFGAPKIDVYQYRLVKVTGKKAGRHRNFDPPLKQELITALEAHYRERIAATGRHPYNVRAVDFVEKLLEERGLSASREVIEKQIVRPVRRALRIGRN
jgi:hypothetical protein